MTVPNVGDRIELVDMPDDPDPVPTGSTGTVVRVVPSVHAGHTQVGVDWDNGRNLNLEIPPDQIRVIPPTEGAP